MPEFRDMTADAVLEALEKLDGRPRRKAAQQLLYKKRARPDDRHAQLRIMSSLAEWDGLNRFDRTYALVASAHKACELVEREAMAGLLPRLEEAYSWAQGLRERNVLRMDGVHLRFSVLNVLINGSLLVRSGACRTHARAALDALDRIDPRRVSPYLYNSSSNIVKTVGLAVVLVPEHLPRRADQVQALLDYGVRLRGTREWLLPLTRRFGARRLADMQAEAAFLEFEESCLRALALRSAARAQDDDARRDALWQVAESCVGQYTEAQKSALLDAVQSMTAGADGDAPARR